MHSKLHLPAHEIPQSPKILRAFPAAHLYDADAKMARLNDVLVMRQVHWSKPARFKKLSARVLEAPGAAIDPVEHSGIAIGLLPDIAHPVANAIGIVGRGLARHEDEVGQQNQPLYCLRVLFDGSRGVNY